MKLEIPDISESFRNKEWKQYFIDWDVACRESLHRVFSDWNDYSEPVIPMDTFIQFLNKAQTVFGSLLENLGLTVWCFAQLQERKRENTVKGMPNNVSNHDHGSYSES